MVIKDRLNGVDGKEPVAIYSSIKSLGLKEEAVGEEFNGILRGSSSLGKCINDQGIDAVPSPRTLSPGGMTTPIAILFITHAVQCSYGKG